MTNVAVSADRSVRRPESAMSWHSSARYGGSWLSSDLWISSASLNSTRCRIGNQWSWRCTGIMCSRRPVPVTRRAAAFWMPCSRWNRQVVGHAEEQWVAVIQSSGHKRLHQCPDDALRQWSGDWSQLPQLMIAAPTECIDVAWQTELTIFITINAYHLVPKNLAVGSSHIYEADFWTWVQWTWIQQGLSLANATLQCKRERLTTTTVSKSTPSDMLTAITLTIWSPWPWSVILWPSLIPGSMWISMFFDSWVTFLPWHTLHRSLSFITSPTSIAQKHRLNHCLKNRCKFISMT